jgi:phosphoribosyl-ATP pyrophosphohydrolase
MQWYHWSTWKLDDIHPADRLPDMPDDYPYSGVMKHIGDNGEYFVLANGQKTIRVKSSVCRPIPTPEFDYGDFVRAFDKTERYGIVTSIDWHYKYKCHAYWLTINGKWYKKRYFGEHFRLVLPAEESGNMNDDMLNQLEAIIADRRANPKEGSYTNLLFEKGRNKIAQKVGEEAVEVIVAALGQGREEQVGELSDLFYHTLVLMSDLDISLDDIRAELEKRHR